MMTTERCDLYRAALELDAAQRSQFLAEACAGDEALRVEVTALLNSDLRDSHLDRPTLELAASAPTERQVGHCRLLSLLGKDHGLPA